MEGFASLDQPPKGETPLVVGIITVNATTQVKMAKKAMDAFVQQTYQRKKLVVVAPHELDAVPEGVKVLVRPPATHRQLFESARMEEAPNQCVTCWWPYDSYSPPLRLDRQMSAQRAGASVAFDSLLLYDALKNNAVVVAARNGFASTALSPRHVSTYEGEGGDVVPHVPSNSLIVLRGGQPRYLPVVRFRDAVNRYPESLFLPPGSPPGTSDSWMLGDELKRYLESVLEKYGLKRTAAGQPPRVVR